MPPNHYEWQATYDYSPEQPARYYTHPLLRDLSSGGHSQASNATSSSMGSVHNDTGSPRPGDYSYSRGSSSTMANCNAGHDASPRQAEPESYPFSSSPTQRRRQMADEDRDWPVQCLSPDCKSNPFKRSADLERHYRNAHGGGNREDFYCDYQKCTRYQEPFHRRDHYRDHLREFHREDIAKRGTTITESWFEGRYLPLSWWRCSKCLRRVSLAADEYQCVACQTSCETQRQQQRRKLMEQQQKRPR